MSDTPQKRNQHTLSAKQDEENLQEIASFIKKKVIEKQIEIKK